MEQKNDFLSPRVQYLSLEKIRPNSQQPRRQFDPQALEELRDSIRSFGILQPLTVRRINGGYELVTGERRLRAASLAGLRQVPCLIARVDERDSALLALIENLQRRDLHFLEEATAIARLITQYDLTQEQAAQKLGKSQSAIANKLRLLRLREDVCAAIVEGNLSERHARALLRLSSPEEQLCVARSAAKKRWNVAQTEKHIESILQHKQVSPVGQSRYILKDVRLFLNSIQRQVSFIQQGGIGASLERRDAQDAIVLTIRIPTGEKKL